MNPSVFLFALQALQATEGQTEELRGHVIIAGFGRVGQLIGQLLAERLIPFVAVDVRMDCVQVCWVSWLLYSVGGNWPGVFRFL